MTHSLLVVVFDKRNFPKEKQNGGAALLTLFTGIVYTLEIAPMQF